jgi:GTPase SAR1 family protein
MYYRNAVAAVIVFDVTNRSSFEQVQCWVNELKCNIANIVLVICGNKIDLGTRRVVEDYEAQAVADSANSIYIETSAVTSAGLDFLFQTVVQHSIESTPGILTKPKTDLAELSQTTGTSRCC